MKAFTTKIMKLVIASCPNCNARLPIGNGDTGDYSREVGMWGNVSETMVCEMCSYESRKPKRLVNRNITDLPFSDEHKFQI